MSQMNFDQWSESAKKMQAPFQAMAELNAKTLQSLSYLKPEDLMGAKKPEEFLEKQITLAVDNGRKALDYMQKSFDIFEKAILMLVDEAKVKIKK